MIQVNYNDRSFTIEEMTEEEKNILQEEKPELHKKYFKEEKVKKNNQLKKK